MCNLVEELEKDFIESMVSYEECSEATAKDMWNMHGEEYLADVFDDMSNRMTEISHQFNADNGEN